MKVYLNSITGIEDAIRTMYMSKRTWTKEWDDHMVQVVNTVTSRNGMPRPTLMESDYGKEFLDWINKLIKWGSKHITMLRFIDLSVTVEGLHRGAVDDLDSHSKRMENRIIRSSTRLATYETEEISDWYKDKTIPTDMALSMLSIDVPEKMVVDGKTYVKSTNGYIREDLKDNKDVKRGLYMLSLPMTFTFKINITELAHVYKERGSKEGGAHGTAAPELQLMMEDLVSQVESWYPQINRELLLKIVN